MSMDHITAPDTWESLIALPDEQIPLMRAALLIARDEYPGLDLDDYEARFGELVDALAARIDPERPTQERLAELNRVLFHEHGFSGNQQDYYDPRNSYLNEVIDRRLGIPISLGLIQMELADRVGVPLEGVSFPGHFLVRLPVEDGLLVLDPFQRGRSIDADELRERARPHVTGGQLDDAELLQLLAPASRRAILMRMLRNLKALYAEAETWEKALRCADRLVSLDPEQPDELRDRGLLYLKMEHTSAARDDLARYLRMRPEADDAESVRHALVEASATRRVIN